MRHPQSDESNGNQWEEDFKLVSPDNNNLLYGEYVELGKDRALHPV